MDNKCTDKQNVALYNSHGHKNADRNEWNTSLGERFLGRANALEKLA